MAMAARGVVWVLTTTLGLAVGGFIFHFPGSFGGLPGWDITATVFGLLIGFVSGVVVGLLQWAGLLLGRREGIRLLLWMGVGIGITHALHDGGPDSLTRVGVSAVSGLVMAAAYLWAIRDRRPVPAVVVGVAWAGALFVANEATNRMGLPWEDTPVGWSTDHLFSGLIAGVIFGIATAVAGIPERLRHPAPPDLEAAPSPPSTAFGS
jgi:hypothetical protein